MRALISKRLQTTLQQGLSLAALGALGLAHAGLTDISQTPLLTASGTPVKPNVMVVLDDSGSMDYDYLPEAGAYYAYQYGSHTARCNGLAYNPDSSYAVPVDSTGVDLSSGSISTVMAADLWLTDVASASPTNITQVSSGTVTVYPSGSRTYSVGQPVTLYDLTDKTRWMIGIVSSWTSKTREAKITVSGYSAAGTMVTPYLGKGWPQFVHFSYSGSTTSLGYTYSSTGATDTSTTFYKECNSVIGATPGSGVYTTKIIRTGDADAQKLANWWAYYSTRMKMMKTVLSHVFKDMDDNYRIGYMTIHATQAVESTSKNFLHIRDFDSSQKANFYTYFNAAPTANSTPLRGSLALAGRYYAKKARNQGTVDPVQYSCQKNFTILATDGQWNTGDESTSTYFGPYNVTSSAYVGQQDSAVDKPYRDASQGTSSGGSSNSLADIAMYYFATDLRTSTLSNCTGAMGVDVCTNNVKTTTRDKAEWQHMTTYTLSLGQNGTITYDANYETQASGTYYNITQGTHQWPNPVESSSTDPGKIDDLWHAAVNGRGVFYNAANAAAVTQGLKTALAEINKLTATGAAAATSTLRPVTGNNQVFIARYTSGLWVGDLRAYRMDVETGEVATTDANNNDLAEWSAAAKLKARTPSDRTIYYARSGALSPFISTDTALATEFSNACTNSKLSQCSGLSTTDKTTANSGATLINYLRGTENSVFRAREQVLGDIVGSAPSYVGVSDLSYTTTGYSAYAAGTSTRRAMVYVGANDGMLHAFDASTGAEVWAFIPTVVRSSLYKLADTNYTTNHQYFVDGTLTAADVQIGGQWRTILVFGLGAGGKAYVALDVTNPNSPSLLWEFTDTNLGYSYAQPLVVQRTNGDWAVVLSSGYNNVGDGKGHFYMLDAGTGAKLVELSTTEGSTTTPSGLGPISAWVESSGDAVAKRFYAGDTLGNVWRFDPDGNLGLSTKVVKLATLINNTVVQPITTAPVLAKVNQGGYEIPVVFIGTGRMLGLTDVENTATQSIYGIKDLLTVTGWGDIRGTGSTLVQQTLSTSGSTRTATKNPVDWSTNSGWFVDLPDTGERINVDMMLRYNTLVAGSNVPQSVASCTDTSTGYAWLYYLDIAFGSNTGTTVATKLSNSMLVGLGAYELSNGKGGVVVTYSNSDLDALNTPKPVTYLPTAKKSAWRELIDR